MESALPAVTVGDQGLPSEIQWMPPGRHTISPMMEGKSATVTLTVDASLATQAAQAFAELRTRAAAGQGDVPFLDFAHQDGESAAEVLDLYWAGDDPRLGGIRAKVRWTSAGEAALKGRNYRRFSPQWLVDRETGQFAGLSENLGGLVNRAAFQTIQPVVARRGGPTQHVMTDAEKTELTTLVTGILKPLNDRLAAVEAKQAAPAPAPAQPLPQDRLAALESRIVAVEAASGRTTVAHAKERVQVHARRGAIPPQNADVIAFWETQYQADPAKTEAVLSAMPDNPAMAAQFTAGGGKGTPSQAKSPAEAFAALVQAKRADGRLSATAALELAIAENLAGYDAWRKANGQPAL